MSVLAATGPVRQRACSLPHGLRPADVLLVAAVVTAAACGGGWYVLLAAPAVAGVVLRARLRVRLRRVSPCSGERAREGLRAATATATAVITALERAGQRS